MHKIKVDYETGDSFGTETTYCYIKLGEPHYSHGDYIFNEVSTCSDNLKRIRDHYKFLNNRNNYVSCGSKKAEESWIEASKEVWFYGEPTVKYQLSWEKYLYLLDNNGDNVKCYAPWIGYFERLLGASLEVYEDENGTITSFEI